jgi:hypothetical protein
MAALFWYFGNAPTTSARPPTARITFCANKYFHLLNFVTYCNTLSVIKTPFLWDNPFFHVSDSINNKPLLNTLLLYFSKFSENYIK